MTDEIKSIEHHPDRRGFAKRGRPFFSLRRRIDPDAEQKWQDRRRRYYEELSAVQAKVFLVAILVGIGIFVCAALFAR